MSFCEFGKFRILTIFMMISTARTWDFPNPTFIKTFANHFSRNSLIYYLPSNIGKSKVHESHKKYVNSYPIRFIYQKENLSLNLQKEDLHIFLFDEENLKKNQYQILESMIQNRTRTNREFWLFDISAFEANDSIEIITDHFDSLHLDLGGFHLLLFYFIFQLISI